MKRTRENRAAVDCNRMLLPGPRDQASTGHRVSFSRDAQDFAVPKKFNGLPSSIDNRISLSFPLISVSVLIRRGARRAAPCECAGREHHFGSIGDRRAAADTAGWHASGRGALFFALHQLPDLIADF
jgi:hypothetical protein